MDKPTAPVATEQAQAVAASAFALKWPGDTRLNLSTVFDTEAEAIDWLTRCAPGVVVVPLFAASPEAAPVAPLLLQDENSGREGRRYNEWHASRPDARLNAREAAAAVAATPTAPSAAPTPEDDLLVACITLNGTTLTVEADALADMFGTDDEQHAYELTFKRMTRAAFEALGDFNGF